MASGDPVVQILDVSPPATAPATPDTKAGGDGTSAERRPVWDFDDTTNEYLDFYCALAGYDDGGLTFHLVYQCTSNTTAAKVAAFNGSIRRLDTAEDFDGVDHDYGAQSKEETSTAPTTVGTRTYTTLAFTHGTQMDSLADGEEFVFRVWRNAAHASKFTGDAELTGFWGVET